MQKPNLKNAVLRITLISSLRASCTMRANGFSHVYILITFIPLMISFISLIRRSVLVAVSTLNLANCRPIQDWKGTAETKSRAAWGSFLAESVFKRDWLTHNKSIWADPLVEENSDNEQLEWSAPEVVEEYDRLVKPAKKLLYTKSSRTKIHWKMKNDDGQRQVPDCPVRCLHFYMVEVSLKLCDHNSSN